MVVGIKNTAKLFGISIISCCAVFVCAMFWNYYIDVTAVRGQIISPYGIVFYDAQVSTVKVVCFVTGGCLLATSVVTLFFHIKHYIDTHKKELGILKALGYSNIKVAKNFWVFGLSVLLGTSAGMLGAYAFMPKFYALQNEDKMLPDMTVHFHPSILICFVIVPTVFFALLSVFYAYFRLKQPVLLLLREGLLQKTKANPKKQKTDKSSDKPFLSDLRRSTLKSKKTLLFFILFSSFCYSALTQMSFSMKDLSSEMMGMMMLVIGLVLAFTTLFLAITTVINGSTKTIAMMRVFGYSDTQCRSALLDGYRPVSYVGFALGTIYQYALLRLMVDIVFSNIAEVPEYKFDYKMMFVSLITFVVVYELVMYLYALRIRKISVKAVMLD